MDRVIENGLITFLNNIHSLRVQQNKGDMRRSYRFDNSFQNAVEILIICQNHYSILSYCYATNRENNLTGIPNTHRQLKFQNLVLVSGVGNHQIFPILFTIRHNFLQHVRHLSLRREPKKHCQLPTPASIIFFGPCMLSVANVPPAGT